MASSGRDDEFGEKITMSEVIFWGGMEKEKRGKKYKEKENGKKERKKRKKERKKKGIKKNRKIR